MKYFENFYIFYKVNLHLTIFMLENITIIYKTWRNKAMAMLSLELD
jgi:hypothetical protein